MSFVPDVERRIIGLETSVRAASAAGLFVRSKPYGMLPPSSPTSSGLSSRAARGSAASSEGTGKQRRPRATAVVAVVVDVARSALRKAVDHDSLRHPATGRSIRGAEHAALAAA